MPSSLLKIVVVVLLLVTALSCSNITRISEVHAPDLLDTSDKELADSGKRTRFFSDDGVYFSSDFDGGRAGRISRHSRGQYEIAISPENVPINDSPWYAFKLWSLSEQQISITLSYEHGSHRYHPKISSDGENWTPLATPQHFSGPGENQAKMIVDIGETPTWISAQELVTSTAIANWAETLAHRSYVELSTIGVSPLGKPILKLEIGENSLANPSLVVLGRQHPAEVTGSFALMAFIEAISGDSQLAKWFRQNYQVVALPLLNPDGVDLGHWRHNSRGVDLNRDWSTFQQSETRMARDALETLGTHGVVAALDFHSTYEDIFYLMEGLDTTFEETWIRRMAKQLLDYEFRIQEVAADSPVAMSWLSRRFAIPVITYEVGDDTPRQTIERIGTVAAETLMDMLLAINEQPVTQTLQEHPQARRAAPSLPYTTGGFYHGNL